MSKAEEVEFDETITGWGSGHRPAPSKKGSPARRRLEKHNKDLRDKLAADKLARKVETGRIKPNPKPRKIWRFDETTTGWSNSKETEAGERDVGSDEYANYVKTLTPGEKAETGVHDRDARKAEVKQKKEKAIQNHQATRIDDEYEPTKEDVAYKILKKLRSDRLAVERARRERMARRQAKHEEVDVEEGIGRDPDRQNPSTRIKEPIDISGFKGTIKKIPPRKRDKKDPARAQGTPQLSRPVVEMVLVRLYRHTKVKQMFTKPPAVSDAEVEKFKKKNTR